MTRRNLKENSMSITTKNCPADCDRTYTNSGHQGGWNSDHNGACRHGVYVGGSGADYMCGACEDGDSLDPEPELPDWAQARADKGLCAVIDGWCVTHARVMDAGHGWYNRPGRPADFNYGD